MANETAIRLYDRVLFSVAVSIMRPRNNSFEIFDAQSQVLIDKELKTRMDGYNRQTIKLLPGESKQITLVEEDYCNLLLFVSSGNVAVQLLDTTPTGFGGSGFGGGSFGGSSLGEVNQGINGTFLAEGRFTDLVLTSLETTITVSLDITAIKFEEGS